MSDAIDKAKAAFERWNTAFNTGDMDRVIAEMHFPHRRLSGDNEFQVWQTEHDFRAIHGETFIAQLNAEGWDHTVTTSIEAVQSGPDKVHLAINQSRRRADGAEYNAFPTLWIFTKINGRWGAQFRSSFLSDPVPSPGDAQTGSE